MNENMGTILFDIKGMIFGMNLPCYKKYKFPKTMVCYDIK